MLPVNDSTEPTQPKRRKGGGSKNTDTVKTRNTGYATKSRA